MKLSNALQGVTRLFLDSGPVIYYGEAHPRYLLLLREIFTQLSAGWFAATVSPVTLAECLVLPYRLALPARQQVFLDLVLHGANTSFADISSGEAQRAADLRARYNIGLLDALQFAVALRGGCDAFLTNDHQLRRVSEIRVLVLDDLEP